MARLTVTVARSEDERLRGYLGRTEIGEDEALLFEHTKFLHTFGMQTRIDIIFLDKSFRIVRLFNNAAPWRIYAALGAAHALELAPGAAVRKGLVLGGVLALERENVDVR